MDDKDEDKDEEDSWLVVVDVDDLDCFSIRERSKGTRDYHRGCPSDFTSTHE